MHKATFRTILGEMKFGPDGEQPEPRTLCVQYQGIEGNDIEQFKRPGKQVILYPPQFRSGSFRYPYVEARR